jgi:hypothetical protein
VTNSHRPRIIAVVMLLRDALGRFIRIRELVPSRSRRRRSRPRHVRSVSVQLVLF